MAPAVREMNVIRYRVAGFWQRALATIIDGLILLPVFALLSLLLGKIFGGRIPRIREMGLDYVLELLLGWSPLVMGGAVLCLAVGTMYFVLFHASRGQTLGKQLLRIRVITRTGDRPDLPRSLLREAAALGSFLLGSLGLVWIGFDREKRGLHDHLAGTYVVRA
jgi:uncharacterized RDD family membrane protein YckC